MACEVSSALRSGTLSATDTGAGLEVGGLAFQDHGSAVRYRVHVAAKIDIAHGAAIMPRRWGSSSSMNLHSPDTGAPSRFRRQTGAQGVEADLPGCRRPVTVLQICMTWLSARWSSLAQSTVP